MLQGFSLYGEPEVGGDYDDRARKRRLAEALMQQGMDYSPTKSWTQGAARLAQALVGGYESGKYDREQKAADAPARKLMDEYRQSMFGGSTAPAAAGAGPAPAPMAPGPVADAGGGAGMSGDMAAYAVAIKKKESAGSGDYAAVGPTHPKLGRALGAYQVMEANIGPWSREALGREVTPDEFMKNPQIQDQIFQHKFGQYVQKFGNPQDAASAWFTGRPLAQGANARDVLGTTGAGYVADFNRNIGQQPTQVAQAGMTPDGMPTSPVASDAPPMAYAPGGMPQSPPMPPQAPRGQQLAQAVGAPAIAPPQPTGNVGAALMAAAMGPGVSPRLQAQAMQMYQMGQRDEGVRPVDLGDKIALMDTRGNIRQVLPKSQAPRGPMAIGPDQRLIDPTTGREIAGAQDGGKAPAVQKVKLPDGSEVAVQWDRQRNEWVPLKAPEGGNAVANPKLTEVQSKDVGFYNRGTSILPRLEKQDKALTDSVSALGGKVPVVGNYLKSDAYRQAEQTGRELLAVILRKDTGAAVTDSEMSLYSNMYLPQPGDDAATIKQKQEGRKTAIEGIRMGLGTAEILFKQREALDAAKGGGAQQQQQPKADPSGALAAARDAIARGAPRDAVIKRLQENGIDAAGL